METIVKEKGDTISSRQKPLCWWMNSRVKNIYNIFGRHSSDVTSKTCTSLLAFYEADGTLHSWVLMGVSDIKVCLLCSLWVWKGGKEPTSKWEASVPCRLQWNTVFINQAQINFLLAFREASNRQSIPYSTLHQDEGVMWARAPCHKIFQVRVGVTYDLHMSS